MFRALRLPSHPVSAAQLSASVLAVLLLATVDGTIPVPAEASAGSRQIAVVRRSQERAEKRMRAADLRINALKRARRAGPKRAKQATRRFDRLKQRRAAARVRRSALADRASVARLDLDRRVRARPDPMGRQRPPKAKVRKRVKVLDKKVARVERKVRRLERKTLRAGKKKGDRTASRREISRRIARQVARRDAAEAVLGSDIKQMVALAKKKAAARSRARPARSGFSWPARGTVSQGYGCTHRKKVNGRSSCVQSHDGIDIATPRGATVRASATGVVAYVGWNPWDNGKRAFVVIIGHAGGFETIYGHLQPRRRVKAGQLVRKGQKIGFAGSTGRSTGPHVHWEVSRDFVTRDPRSRR